MGISTTMMINFLKKMKSSMNQFYPNDNEDIKSIFEYYVDLSNKIIDQAGDYLSYDMSTYYLMSFLLETWDSLNIRKIDFSSDLIYQNSQCMKTLLTF